MNNNRHAAKNVLVTGGSGFIGSSFIRRIFSNNDFDGVIVNLDALTYAGNPENLQNHVDEERYRFVHGDIQNAELVMHVCKEHQIDTFINFAAESHVDRSIVGPAAFIQANIVGTFSLLEVARKCSNIHFHQVSTDEVYGSLGKTGRFVETTPYHPNSPYAASKAASDHLVRSYAHTYGLSTTISNCSNNYGPYQFPEKLIPLMLLNIVEKKPLPIYGDGSNIRDWLYVDDHSDALWTIVQSGQAGETYNIGGDSEWSNMQIVHQLIDLLADELGADVAELRALITFVADRPGHDQRYAIDCEKIKKELGWKAKHDFRAGLQQTVRWYLKNTKWTSRVRSGAYRDWLKTNYGSR